MPRVAHASPQGRRLCPTRQLHIMCQHLRPHDTFSPHDTLLQFRGRVVARVMRLREFRRRSRGLSEHRCITSPRPG